MARINNLTNFLTDVATAIKNKTNTEEAIPAQEFDTKIMEIQLKELYEQRTITIASNGSTVITPSEGYGAIDQLIIVTNVPIKKLQTKTYTFTRNMNLEIEPDTGYDGFSKVGLEINVETPMQSKTLDVISNGTYTITPDEGYEGLTDVNVNVQVAAQAGEQHMPFYMLESDDAGNLYCVNNYSEMLYVPYSLDENGNLIVTQDDDDSGVYSINENMELEVVVNG